MASPVMAGWETLVYWLVRTPTRATNQDRKPLAERSRSQHKVGNIKQG